VFYLITLSDLLTRWRCYGYASIASHFRVTRERLVGGTGIPLDEFLATPAEAWL
jgi:hypothetical protein